MEYAMETNSRKNDLCQSQLRQTNLGRLIHFIERFVLGLIERDAFLEHFSRREDRKPGDDLS